MFRSPGKRGMETYSLVSLSTQQRLLAVAHEEPHWTVLVGRVAGAGDSFGSAYRAALRRRRHAGG